MHKRIVYMGFLALCLALAGPHGCSPKAACEGEASSLTLDPNGSTCSKKCDCNNQNYTGQCLDGVCKSREREPCSARGKQAPCILDPPPAQGCKEGIQICQPDYLTTRSWGDCKAVAATDEKDAKLCLDGLDNDCDGKADLADEDCKAYCRPGTTEPCYTGPKGSENQGLCKLGTRTCQADGTWASECIGEVTPTKEVCNGKDDDCNGTDDDGCACVSGKTRACYKEGAQGCSKAGESYNCDGTCKAGEQTCKEDGTWSTCAGMVLPVTPEACDNKDDDCDGTVDNGCDCTGNQTRICGKDVGLCQKGTQRCQDGRWGTCEGEVKAKAEACNDADDDCDGLVDEDLTRECYTGSGGCTAQPDGTYRCVTPCKAGTQRCTKGSWVACEGESKPGTEVCNGKDDDCNGQIDDNLTLLPACANQQGVCKGATHTSTQCVAGQWQACTEAQYKAHSSDYSTTESTCDTRDNNCDGRVDEGVAGCVTTLAGEGTANYKDGPAAQAQFASPAGIAIDSQGNLYIADAGNNRIRKLDTSGMVSTIAGSGTGGFQDGPATTAKFMRPYGLTIDAAGNLYIADTFNNRIRKLDTNGMVSTIAGSSSTPGYQDGPGAQARFNKPYGLAIDATGNLYIADTSNHRLRKFDTNGMVSTIAGTGTSGYQDGPGNQAQFAAPYGVAVDSTGNLYVTDYANHRIRKIDTSGMVSTIAGTGTSGHKDGTGSQAQFAQPAGIIIDSAGTLFITDTRNYQLRKLDTSGMVSTLSGSTQGYQDGGLLQAKFNYPYGLAIDAKGNLTTTDTNNNRIRKITR